MAQVRRASLAYSPKSYQAYNLRHGSLTEAQMRAEYSRLRSTAMKRLERIGKTEFVKVKTYTMNIDKFPKLKDLRPQELPERLEALSKLITGKAGTLTGLREIRRKSVETLHSHDYTYINEENYLDFIDFLEIVEELFKDTQYSSEMVIELFEALNKRNLPIREFLEFPVEAGDTFKSNFEYWHKHRAELEAADARAAARGEESPKSAEEYKAAIAAMEKESAEAQAAAKKGRKRRK